MNQNCLLIFPARRFAGPTKIYNVKTCLYICIRTRLLRRPILALLAAVASFALAAPLTARGDGPGTLLQWSYGTSFSGGPDLNEPIVTDRPDFTESSSTIGQGVLQLEMGYTYSYDSSGAGSTRCHSYPETLLRVGMFADWFEWRLDWNYADERFNAFGGGGDTSASGAEDLGIGCKIGLTPQECMLPETAIILQMSVPSGSSNFTADEILPGGAFLYGWDLNDQWATGALSGINRAVDDETGEPYVELAQSWTIVRSWTDIVSSYAEWYVLAASGADSNHTEHYFNGGFTVLLTNDLQWDIRAGVGLNGAADDFFTGTGLSIRR